MMKVTLEMYVNPRSIGFHMLLPTTLTLLLTAGLVMATLSLSGPTVVDMLAMVVSPFTIPHLQPTFWG
jgi:hypothetical protein